MPVVSAYLESLTQNLCHLQREKKRERGGVGSNHTHKGINISLFLILVLYEIAELMGDLKPNQMILPRDPTHTQILNQNKYLVWKENWAIYTSFPENID